MQGADAREARRVARYTEVMPLVNAVVSIGMRWLHIVSVIAILGGFIYARFVALPALEGVNSAAGKAMVNRFRPILWTALICVAISGIYNYLTKGFYPPGYHMWLGIKLLLVLHIFAAAILYTLPSADDSKLRRQASGIVISGLIIVLISGYLRWISILPGVRP